MSGAYATDERLAVESGASYAFVDERRDPLDERIEGESSSTIQRGLGAGHALPRGEGGQQSALALTVCYESTSLLQSPPMPMDLRALNDFVVAAKRAAYVGNGVRAESSRAGSHDLTVSDGAFSYRDSYFGGTDFLGQEVVWKPSSEVS